MIIENKFETRYLLKLCKMKMKMKMKSWKLLMVRCTSPGSCLCIDLPSPGLLTDRLLTEKNECTRLTANEDRNGHHNLPLPRVVCLPGMFCLQFYVPYCSCCFKVQVISF